MPHWDWSQRFKKVQGHNFKSWKISKDVHSTPMIGSWLRPHLAGRFTHPTVKCPRPSINNLNSKPLPPHLLPISSPARLAALHPALSTFQPSGCSCLALPASSVRLQACSSRDRSLGEATAHVRVWSCSMHVAITDMLWTAETALTKQQSCVHMCIAARMLSAHGGALLECCA